MKEPRDRTRNKKENREGRTNVIGLGNREKIVDLETQENIKLNWYDRECTSVNTATL